MIIIIYYVNMKRVRKLSRRRIQYIYMRQRKKIKERSENPICCGSSFVWNIANLLEGMSCHALFMNVPWQLITYRKRERERAIHLCSIYNFSQPNKCSMPIWIHYGGPGGQEILLYILQIHNNILYYLQQPPSNSRSRPSAPQKTIYIEFMGFYEYICILLLSQVTTTIQNSMRMPRKYKLLYYYFVSIHFQHILRLQMRTELSEASEFYVKLVCGNFGNIHTTAKAVLIETVEPTEQ